MPFHAFAVVISTLPQRHNIRIYHKCKGRKENPVLRIAVWHHKACRVMTNDYPEGRIKD